MAKEKKIDRESLPGYTPPAGRSLVLRLGPGGEEEYLEVDTASLELPTAPPDSIDIAGLPTAEDNVLEALAATGAITEAARKKAVDHLSAKRAAAPKAPAPKKG